MLFFLPVEPISKTGKKPKSRVKRHGYSRKLEALKSRMNHVVSVDILHGIKRFKKRIPKKALMDAWQSGNYEGLEKFIPWEKLHEDMLPAHEKISNALFTSGIIAKEALDPPTQKMLRWDIKNPRIRNYVDTRMGHLIHGIQVDTRKQLRNAVTRHFTKAYTPKEVANEIVGSVGLGERYTKAVDNYRTRLINDDMPISKVDTLVESYEGRLLDSRAMTIARTEVRRASQEGQYNVWNEAANQGFFDKNKAKKVWVIDGNPCPICEPMDGEEVGLDDAWVLPDGSSVFTPGDSHPNCFTEGHLILTNRGEIPIEDVTTNDMVFTHTGQWKKVIETFSREYNGDVIFFMANGNKITSTPNHPFLIGKEWITAQELKIGDQALEVISDKVPIRYISDYPSISKKIIKFLGIGKRFAFCHMPATTMNFYGYLNAWYSEINVVFINCKKRNSDYAILSKRDEKRFFKLRHFPIVLNSNSPLFKVFRGFFSTFHSSVRVSSNIFSKFFCAFFIHAKRSFTTCSFCYAIPNQISLNDMSGKSGFSGNSINSLASMEKLGHDSEITGRNAFFIHAAISTIKRTAFKGKVYNLHIESDNSYICNGIIAHNCECEFQLEIGD